MADIIQFPLPATPNAGNPEAEGGAKTPRHPRGSTLCDRSYPDMTSERNAQDNPLARFDFDTYIRPKLSKLIEHKGIVT